ncbi:MAG: hypothetical protein ACXVH6_06900, partial [Halobacteriota archaeon]
RAGVATSLYERGWWARELLAWHTYTSIKTRLRRGYIGSALSVGGNRCICISGKSSSLSICAQMNIAGAVIAG